jgi:anti-sigma regulatory factor (Ser/Thr protein kinase)
MNKQTFPASIDQLHHMLLFVQDFCLKLNLSEDLIDRIVLATEEAIVNVIRYGYPTGQGEIKLSCEADSNKQEFLKICIQDKGVPFNGAKAAKNIKKKSFINPPIGRNEKIGGYGIYIYAGIMDKVEYERIKGGNLLSLIKYL